MYIFSIIFLCTPEKSKNRKKHIKKFYAKTKYIKKSKKLKKAKKKSKKADTEKKKKENKKNIKY